MFVFGKNRLLKIALGLLLPVFVVDAVASSIRAATQGGTGASSNAAISITLTIAALARITNLDDLNFGTWSGAGDLAVSDDVCIWTSGGSYSITAAGDGTGGAFTLDSGEDEVEYSVKWTDSAGSGTATALTSQTALKNQLSSASTSDCSAESGPTATVEVNIAETELAAALGGNYSGILTLVVAPE